MAQFLGNWTAIFLLHGREATQGVIWQLERSLPLRIAFYVRYLGPENSLITLMISDELLNFSLWHVSRTGPKYHVQK